MKNVKYFIFGIIFLFIDVFYVHASCTDEEIANLKEKADEIKVTYKHLGKVEEEDDIYYNLFEVKVKNISDDLYISIFNGTTKFYPSNGEVIEKFNNGTWTFDIYSLKCGIMVSSIEVFIPRFNIYSLDSLCNGIDGDDFALCGKYYEYDVSYDDFINRVTSYRLSHNIDDNVISGENDTGSILMNLIDYIIEFQVYIVVSLIIILIILILIILIQKKKKRGVLE